ncbi:unnamed protein product [Peronospora destructor]|uniref:non-specific serine/threonine protein kinase n=1 Tax=Peronospora destructor TaxID=86335 RepID=A0AAV0VEB2_9STRA|nr:unnamed protein product [Peronospora destructor]
MENYHILERIGEGSFGKVYRGRRKYSGHIVALKFVTKQGKSARDLKNLRQEINILRQLNHCNIIAMMDSFETDREFCLVTEYAQGELFQVLEDEQSLPEQEIRKIAIQLIQVLHVLHSNRIIHRDMKPQNILIGSRQQIKLCDFGFARAIGHDTSLLRSIKGTPLYMAPELVQKKTYNYTVDLWSLGVILYELAVGKPPFYTDRIVSLIQMIVRDDVQYPSTMSADFQSFLKGLLNKDPAYRLKWPEIFEHPFVQETPEQLTKRLQLERQVRTLPRFFEEKEVHYRLGGEADGKVKPSIERLRSCDEWKMCDPKTGRQLCKPELPDQAYTKMSGQMLSVDDNNGPSSTPKTLKSANIIALESFLGVWDRIIGEKDVKPVDAGLMTTPLFTNAVSLLPLIPIQELSSDTMAKIGSLLYRLYRSLVLVLKSIDGMVDFSSLLQTIDSLHHFLARLVEASEAIHADTEQASKVIYKSVRCCTICTTIANAADNILEEHRDYREFCNGDIAVILLILSKKDAVVATSHSKALKWLGLMIDRSQNLTVLLEVIYVSGAIQTLCEILHASGTSSSPGGRILKDGRDLGLFAIFALAAFVQPDAKCWNPTHPFPVMSLISDDAVPLTSSSLRDVKHLCKLRVKIHLEVGSQVFNSGAVSELVSLLGDEITERVQHKRNFGGNTDRGDADQSTICCILKIFVHACRASSPPSKKLTVTNVVFQKHRDTDIVTILLWGMTSEGLDQIEQYFVTELLSAVLRRGILPKPQIWRCARTLFPLFLHASDTALLSALSTFFAEVIETGNIDESVLGSDGNPDELESQDMELWNLVVHGALTQRCSDAIFRLLSTSATDEVERRGKAQMLTSYNLRAQGLLDSGIVFLLRVASRASSQALLQRQNEQEEGATRSVEIKMFLNVFEHDHVWEIFDGMMASGGGDLLSPWGLFCFLKLLRVVREIQSNVAQTEFAVNDHLLLHLVKLLELKHIEHLLSWPEVVGGGSNAVKALVHATVKVLGTPFVHSVSEELLVNTREILYDTKCVPKLLNVLRFVFSTKQLQLEASVLELPISFLSRLMTSSTHFGSQFVEADGMLVITECGMLRSSCSPSLIIDLLSIVNQVARSSETHCKCILAANLFPQIYELLQHSEAMVRAKTLKCFGNFGRHSALFYHHFITPLDGSSANGTVLNGMIRGLSDPDNYVRRFACSAIGNAAFHSGDLYDALRPAIPVLVQNLHNDDDKTRSNAGGALGNFVRNSDVLCKDLCANRTPWELFRLAMTETSIPTRRIVLFSLGNFCTYPECFNMLVGAELNFVEELEYLYDDIVADEVSRQNIHRIFSKIEALDIEDEQSDLHISTTDDSV